MHITERLAPEVTIAVMHELQHCKLLERIDNQSAVTAMQRRRAKDPRLQELDLVHEMQVEERCIQDEARWIDTKSNLWADMISKGEKERFITLVREAGIRNIIEIDIAAQHIPSDLPEMFERLIELTLLMPRNVRSRDRH